jgi:hypothetical protein
MDELCNDRYNPFSINSVLTVEEQMAKEEGKKEDRVRQSPYDDCLL